MANTKQLAELFRAVANNDALRAAGVAKRIAQGEADRGNHRAARDLIGSLNGFASSGQLHSQTHAATQSLTSQQCLTLLEKPATLDEVELSKSTRDEIATLCAEWKHRNALQKRGVPRRWRLLFHGPPGCGKSATAAALGRQVGLPVYLVRFDSLIGAYLGQTALRLREVFRYAAENPCVLLFDEVDALAKRRGSPQEVGELDRIVIAFMQELEHARCDGFIVATCNLPRLLDDALWRRFDLQVAFPKPTQKQLGAFARSLGKKLQFKPTAAFVRACGKAASYAQAEQMVVNEARRRVLAQLK